MRQWDFVSNRLFDVLACGTPAISDPVPGIDDALRRRRRAVSRSVRSWLPSSRSAWPTRRGRDARSSRSRQVILDQHTFDHRVRCCSLVGCSRPGRRLAERVGSPGGASALESRPVPKHHSLKARPFALCRWSWSGPSSCSPRRAAAAARATRRRRQTTGDPNNFTIWAPNSLKEPLDSHRALLQRSRARHRRQRRLRSRRELNDRLLQGEQARPLRRHRRRGATRRPGQDVARRAGRLRRGHDRVDRAARQPRERRDRSTCSGSIR